jgi:hypothetical protein
MKVERSQSAASVSPAQRPGKARRRAFRKPHASFAVDVTLETQEPRTKFPSRMSKINAENFVSSSIVTISQSHTRNEYRSWAAADSATIGNGTYLERVPETLFLCCWSLLERVSHSLPFETTTVAEDICEITVQSTDTKIFPRKKTKKRGSTTTGGTVWISIKDRKIHVPYG